ALEVAGLETDQGDWAVPHEAHLRLSFHGSQGLKIAIDSSRLNIERYGNTSSASIPIALDEAVRDGRIKPGQTVLMCALGAGISWASALARM
ncbi:MAG: 3-oxoacyl-ACP synthase, partial [Myxococcales bacterium]|nr:3-oxoacyl-ACP synthase [Myxococcales bacterium]